MNGQMTRRLRKTLLEKPEECLFLMRMHFGPKTEEMEPTSLWTNFKRLYSLGKIPQKFIVKSRKGSLNDRK